MKRTPYVALLLAANLLSGATWTSTTGNAIEAELTSRTADTVTLTKVDGKEVTVPLTYLDEASRKQAVETKLLAPPVIPDEQWKKLVAEFPAIQPQAPLKASHNDLVRLRDRYNRAIASFTQAAAASHVRTMRGMVESDLKRIEPMSKSKLSEVPVYSGGVWSGGSGAWREVYAARASLAWLGQVSKRLDSIEKAIKPVEQ